MADAAAAAMSVVLVHTADVEALPLREALAERPELEVVEEVLTTREAISAAERLQPRALVMDMRLGDLAGRGVLRSVRRVSPDTRVVLHARAADTEDPAWATRGIAQLVDAILDPVRPAALVASLVLPGEPLSVPIARSFVTELLGQWDLAALVPASQLLVSEMVANAVQHVPGPCVVDLTYDVDILRIAVSDSGPGMPDLRVMGPTSERGRGLHIVSAFSRAWGVDQLQEGRKLVWAELDPAEVRT